MPTWVVGPNELNLLQLVTLFAILTNSIPVVVKNGTAMTLLKTCDLHCSPPVSAVIVYENSGSLYFMVEPSEDGNLDEYIGFVKDGKNIGIHLVGKTG
jgi:hypothetical protein